jgi:hypothetical protein
LIYRFGRTNLAAGDEMRKTAGPDEISVTRLRSTSEDWMNILAGEPHEIAPWMEAAARHPFHAGSTPLSRTS